MKSKNWTDITSTLYYSSTHFLCKIPIVETCYLYYLRTYCTNGLENMWRFLNFQIWVPSGKIKSRRQSLYLFMLSFFLHFWLLLLPGSLLCCFASLLCRLSVSLEWIVGFWVQFHWHREIFGREMQKGIMLDEMFSHDDVSMLKLTLQNFWAMSSSSVARAVI